MVDKIRAFSTMPARQKIVAVLVAIILIVLVWQIVGLFTSSDTSPAASGNAAATAGGPPSANVNAPQSASTLPKPKPNMLSPKEAELMRLQQETQAKYIAALNELQMLKVERDIAENQREIMKAKQETVTAQKNIVNMLAPGAPTTTAAYAQNLVASGGAAPAGAGVEQQQAPQGGLPPSEVKYSVISVSQLQNKWGAVLGFQGNLYSVSVGDVLPADSSKVVSINKSGVVLEKNGVKQTISLVPII